ERATHLPVLPTHQPRQSKRMSPVRHAAAGRGGAGWRASPATLHLVLYRSDDILRRHVFLVTPRHRL
ncbi:hypothetical protein, partial [Pseudomonas sp. FG-3G]